MIDDGYLRRIPPVRRVNMETRLSYIFPCRVWGEALCTRRSQSRPHSVRRSKDLYMSRTRLAAMALDAPDRLERDVYPDPLLPCRRHSTQNKDECTSRAEFSPFYAACWTRHVLTRRCLTFGKSRSQANIWYLDNTDALSSGGGPKIMAASI